MTDLNKAKVLLIKNNYTCVLLNENEIYYSTKRGVAPLIEFLETHKDFSGFIAADKTVGAGAAHLYVLMGVKKLWANIISEDGLDVLIKNNISVSYNEKVPFIINRMGNDRCPIEKCLEGISDSNEALEKIKIKLTELRNDSI